MSETQTFPWLDGYYKLTGHLFNLMYVKGEKGVTKGSMEGMDINFTSIGEHQIGITYLYSGYEMEETGTLSDGGRKWECQGMMKYEAQHISDEEAKTIENDGDLINALTCPYRIQPEYQGTFIWITGPPGAGKSTVGALLAKNHGYAFYETDCFAFLRNPYVPADSENPTLDSLKQKPLRGPGVQERREMVGKMEQVWADFKAGKGGAEGVEQYYRELAEDVLGERKRIGGDFVAAGCVQRIVTRDLIRSILGEDLYFINLEMDEDSQQERIKARHGDDNEDAVNLLKAEYDFNQPAAADERNTFTVNITRNMTKDDVVKKTLDVVQNIRK